MRHSHIYASLLLVVSTQAFCGAPMTLIPNTSTIQLRSDGSAVAAYTLTNTSKAQLSDFSIYPNPSNHAVATVVQNNTCTSTLNPSASCAFQILITGLNTAASFSLSPQVCAMNNTVCAVAISDYRPTVAVVPVTHPVMSYSALVTGSHINSILPVQVLTQTPGTPIPGFHFITVISESTQDKVKGPGYIPLGITVSPDGNALYVPNPGSGNISIVDVTQTPPTLTNIMLPNPPPMKHTDTDSQQVPPTHAEPSTVVVTPNNQTLFTLDRVLGKAYAIDIPSQTITHTIDFATGTKNQISCREKISSTSNTSLGFFASAINPNGSTVYMTHANRVFAINTSNYQVTPLDCITFGAPSGIAVAPDNSVVYVTDYSNNRLWVLSTSDYLGETFIPVGSQPAGIAVSPNGATAYVANNGDNTLSVINTATNLVTMTIPLTGCGPSGLSVTPDGTQLYVGYEGSPFTSVINTVTFEINDIEVTGDQVNTGNFVG
ncbi:MAG: beta-propeller fold lactonase family protein [Gammaproteobacteria bacterium]